MHFQTATLAAIIGLAAASQSAAPVPTDTSNSGSSSSSKKCDAQSILDACLSSLKPQLDDCPPNNWKCLCEQSTNVLTCYNNCPEHADRFGVSQQTDSYCRAYRANSQLYSSSSATKTSAPTRTATQPATTTADATGSATSSGAAGRLEGWGIGVGSVVGVAVAVLL